MNIPKHIAIIMDGNGRWAKKRLLPRIAGHVRGLKRVKEIVEHCVYLKVEYLTLFAFGRENWLRPPEEVSFLMKLLSKSLQDEFYKLHEKNVKLRFIGDRSRLAASIMQKINQIEELTVTNTGLNLSIAVDYSGTYDIVQAVNQILAKNTHQQISEEVFEKYLLTFPNPNPDLFIRTSGEVRISNFMLWQISYSECYFIETLWPDFNKNALDKAITWFSARERRFGKISEQLIKDE